MPLFGRSKTEPEATSPPEDLVDAEAAPLESRGFADHREHLLGAVTSLRPFGIGLIDSLGLTLCETIAADLELPLFTAARVEGWAVRSANLVGASPHHPVELPIVGEIDRGGYRGEPLTPGTTVRVAAGAPVPEGADAVVALEDGLVRGDGVVFTQEVTFRQHLLLSGSRVADGDIVLDAGAVLTPRALGLLGELGIDKVLARPRPRVVVATLAPELVEPGLPLTRPSQSYDATTALLAGSAKTDGAQVFPIGLLPADPVRLVRTLSEQLLRADLVLLATDDLGVAAGVLADLGEVDRVHVELEPAGDALFAVLGEDRIPVLVVPVDAVGAFIGYHLLGRGLLRVLAGNDPAPAMIQAPVLAQVSVDPDVTTVLPGQLTERGVVPLVFADPIGAVELASVDALIVVEPGSTGILAGHSDVTCWLVEP